jgi:hypothetical protein
MGEACNFPAQSWESSSFRWKDSGVCLFLIEGKQKLVHRAALHILPMQPAYQSQIDRPD